MSTVFVMTAAAQLGVSRRTIYYMLRDGRLHGTRSLGGHSTRIYVWSIAQQQRARHVAPPRQKENPCPTKG